MIKHQDISDIPVSKPDALASVATLTNIKFRWHKAELAILDIPFLNIQAQQHLLIKGVSGSGKSTLLSLLSGINKVEEGEVKLLGNDVGKLSQGQRDQFRADNIGYIFQQFNLLPYLSVVDNVSLACDFSSKRKQKVLASYPVIADPIRLEAIRLLDALNLPRELLDQKASKLSIGQQQRVAAARALIGSPAIIIADEPTSALDHKNSEAFIKLLMQEATRTKATLILVSHDPLLEPLFEQSLDLSSINQAVVYYE